MPPTGARVGGTGGRTGLLDGAAEGVPAACAPAAASATAAVAVVMVAAAARVRSELNRARVWCSMPDPP